ncbi:hypothetical protein ID866_2031 [Astraeus odoratus]|nr:hypothetical protein ID866_2031 [Astraeus odoratus]
MVRLEMHSQRGLYLIIRRPSVPTNLQNLCLARLLAHCETVPPRKRSPRTKNRNLHSGGPPAAADSHENQPTDVHSSGPQEASGPESMSKRPDGLDADNLVVGINQVSRVLECQIRSSRRLAVVQTSGQDGDYQESCPSLSPLAVIFACTADIDPPVLLSHIPHLVASCNSSFLTTKQGQAKIKLVPLPKGSESVVARALGLRRVAVIGVYVNKDSPFLTSLQDVLDAIPDLAAPWLSASDTPKQRFTPTCIKQLRTTVPKDMKAAKEQRLAARKEAKGKMGLSRSPSEKKRLTLSTEMTFGAHSSTTAMFIAIVGTRCSGKSSVECYLTSRGFVPVRLTTAILGVNPGQYDSDFASTEDAKAFGKLAGEIPTSTSLVFTSAAELLDYVTRHWRSNFVTMDLTSLELIGLFAKRPFFMLVNVDAPLLQRYRRLGPRQVPSCSEIEAALNALISGVKEVVYHLSYKVDEASAKLFQEAGVNIRRHVPTTMLPSL